MLIILIGLIACLSLMPNYAAAIVYSLGTGNTSISGYPAPYGSVTVDLTSGTTAQITFDYGSSGGYNYLFIDGGAFDLNVNGTYSISNFSASNTFFSNGFVNQPTLTGNTPGQVDGFGKFDLSLNLFDATGSAASTASFLLTDTSGVWTSAADVLTPNDPIHKAEFAAHLAVFYGTPVNDQQKATGFAAGNTGTSTGGPPPVNTPEPGSLFLLVGSLISIGAFSALRKKF